MKKGNTDKKKKIREEKKRVEERIEKIGDSFKNELFYYNRATYTTEKRRRE